MVSIMTGTKGQAGEALLFEGISRSLSSQNLTKINTRDRSVSDIVAILHEICLARKITCM